MFLWRSVAWDPPCLCVCVCTVVWVRCAVVRGWEWMWIISGSLCIQILKWKAKNTLCSRDDITLLHTYGVIEGSGAIRVICTREDTSMLVLQCVCMCGMVVIRWVSSLMVCVWVLCDVVESGRASRCCPVPMFGVGGCNFLQYVPFLWCGIFIGMLFTSK